MLIFIERGNLSFDRHYNGDNRSNVHCTSFFTNRGRIPGSGHYARKVERFLGKAEIMTLVGMTFTPRTASIRVKLDPNQLDLWKQDDDERRTDTSTARSQRGATALPKRDYNDVTQMFDRLSLSSGQSASKPTSRFHPTSGVGSRAHITIGYHRSSEAVQAGFDQMDIVECETMPYRGKTVNVDGAAARYYQEGRCAIYFNEPVKTNALFSGRY